MTCCVAFISLAVITCRITLGFGKESSPKLRSAFDTDDADAPINYAAYVARAVESGLNDATDLFEVIEPALYKQDIYLRGDHPSVYLAAINRQTPRAKELSRHAYATLRATTFLKEQLAQVRDDREPDPQLSKVSLRNTPLQYSNCPHNRQASDCPDVSAQYRLADGICNNLNNPTWGSSFQPFARYLQPEYDDGISTIRKSITGKELPSPRLISTRVHKDVSRPSSTFTLMLMQWGQFLDHDLTQTSQTRSFNHSVPKCCNVTELHPDCLPIEIPADDPYFNGTTCMEFIRSSPSPRHDCSLGAREQLNQLTSWLDGSVVYGSTEEDMRHLRLYKGGKLKYHNMLNRKALLPRLHHPHEGECIVSSPRLFCFAAGDGRANEQPGLTTMHTIWLRQHNLLAEKLALLNPHWREEIVFQEARKIVIAYMQHITYREFLPLVLGPNVMKVFGLRLLRTGYYTGYNESVDGSIPTAFGTAAFRFGHSLVQPNLHRSDEAHREMPYNVKLSMELMSPSNLHNFGEVDRISLGLASQMSQRRDEFITTELTNHLFRTQGHKGLDLASINIQRGRDHGLAPYLKWRDACGLLKPLHHNGPLVTWNDFAEATGISRGQVDMLATAYESPWDIDLFPGGMVELPVRGGLVGPTFACIIAQTFRNLRRGDRYWYENPGQFTTSQLQVIRNVSLARVICDTSDSIQSMQPIVFLAPHLQKNPHAHCSDKDVMPYVELTVWNQFNPEERSSYVKPAKPLQKEAIPNDLNFYSMSELYDSAESFTDDFVNTTLGFFDSFIVK